MTIAEYLSAIRKVVEAWGEAEGNIWTAESYEAWRESEPDCRNEDD